MEFAGLTYQLVVTLPVDRRRRDRPRLPSATAQGVWPGPLLLPLWFRTWKQTWSPALMPLVCIRTVSPGANRSSPTAAKPSRTTAPFLERFAPQGARLCYGLGLLMETTDASNAVGEHGKHGTIFPWRV